MNTASLLAFLAPCLAFALVGRGMPDGQVAVFLDFSRRGRLRSCLTSKKFHLT